MKRYKTHDECRKQFVEEMEQILFKFDAIDRDTVWSRTEPKWWIDMSDLKKQIKALILSHKSNN